MGRFCEKSEDENARAARQRAENLLLSAKHNLDLEDDLSDEDREAVIQHLIEAEEFKYKRRKKKSVLKVMQSIFVNLISARNAHAHHIKAKIAKDDLKNIATHWQNQNNVPQAQFINDITRRRGNQVHEKEHFKHEHKDQHHKESYHKDTHHKDNQHSIKTAELAREATLLYGKGHSEGKGGEKRLHHEAIKNTSAEAIAARAEAAVLKHAAGHQGIVGAELAVKILGKIISKSDIANNDLHKLNDINTQNSHSLDLAKRIEPISNTKVNNRVTSVNNISNSSEISKRVGALPVGENFTKTAAQATRSNINNLSPNALANQKSNFGVAENNKTQSETILRRDASTPGSQDVKSRDALESVSTKNNSAASARDLSSPITPEIKSQVVPQTSSAGRNSAASARDLSTPVVPDAGSSIASETSVNHNSAASARDVSAPIAPDVRPQATPEIAPNQNLATSARELSVPITPEVKPQAAPEASPTSHSSAASARDLSTPEIPNLPTQEVVPPSNQHLTAALDIGSTLREKNIQYIEGNISSPTYNATLLDKGNSRA